MTPRLSVVDVSVVIGERPVLQDLTLHLRGSERLALLGANGAGKTTLLRLLDRLVPALGGEMRLDGRVMTERPVDLRRWRQAVGFLFQDPDDQLFGPTVLEDVALGPRNLGLPAGRARDLARDALEALGIGGLASEPVHVLSLGQRRSVALAGVLVMCPSVLLLDEPTQGLDARAETALLHALEHQVGAGAAVVMATHDISLAHAWADRVVILQEGRLVASGSPDDVLAGPVADALALRRPWVPAAGVELRRLGVLDADEALPRSGEALVERLRRAESTEARRAC